MGIWGGTPASWAAGGGAGRGAGMGRGAGAGGWVEARRWTQLIVGLFLYGVAIVLMIRSGLGLGPWDAFHVGLHRLTGMSVGVASIVVGLVIIVGTVFIGVRPGPGTIANMVLIGVFIDVLMPVFPALDGGWLGLAYFVAGIVLTGLATGFYIAPGFGKGPRDGLMLGLAGVTGWSVRRVRTGIEATVLVLGWAMGAKIGVGTVLFAVGIGPVTQWGLRLFGVVPEPARAGIRVRRRAPRG